MRQRSRHSDTQPFGGKGRLDYRFSVIRSIIGNGTKRQYHSDIQPYILEVIQRVYHYVGYDFDIEQHCSRGENVFIGFRKLVRSESIKIHCYFSPTEHD